ncbi:type II toxin-antitoxin system YafQ family toxin [Enterococcus faecalis]|nr:type II toxin-antitoxin system YafQ family toxin [Enterococcus faecalis]EHK9982035.1 type II toxin-antitoxin system YafQ family toxin [Enterococcus faecalis]
MTRQAEYLPQFKRDVKCLKKKHYDMEKLAEVIRLIEKDDTETLKIVYNDHSLSGSHQGLRELHIEGGNWLLVYELNDEEMIFYLLATGSHDDIFRRTLK